MESALLALPGGTYVITPQRDAALREALAADPGPGNLAHPIFYYIASQVGMGLTVAELCARCDFNLADGAMITKSDVDFVDDLRVGDEYAVSGEIVSLIRKPSRTFGAVDVLTYRLRLTHPSRGLAATCVNEWILPRKGASA